jgi:hypothetical protein
MFTIMMGALLGVILGVGYALGRTSTALRSLQFAGLPSTRATLGLGKRAVMQSDSSGA